MQTAGTWDDLGRRGKGERDQKRSRKGVYAVSLGHERPPKNSEPESDRCTLCATKIISGREMEHGLDGVTLESEK